jgi:hypothetical protein
VCDGGRYVLAWHHPQHDWCVDIQIISRYPYLRDAIGRLSPRPGRLDSDE